MSKSLRNFVLIMMLVTTFCSPAIWAQDDDDDDGGSEWWVWPAAGTDSMSLDFSLLGPEQTAKANQACQEFFVRGTLISPARSSSTAFGSTTVTSTSSSVEFEETVGPDQVLNWTYESTTDPIIALKVTVWRMGSNGKRLSLKPGCQPQISNQSAGDATRN
jgi:hypothetical protein